MSDSSKQQAAAHIEESKSSLDLDTLGKKSVRGGVVTMVSQIITIFIQLASTVVLARLLTPGDYGTVAMVTVVIAFAGLFRELGLSAAAIQKKDLTRAQQSNLFWINLAMGSFLTFLIACCAPLVANFYGKPELHSVTVVLSFSFVIGSVGTQHGAMLVRNMQFGRQAIARISGAVIMLIVSIVMAMHGYSYWSLVWGGLSASSVTTIMLLFLSPFRPAAPSKNSGIREMLGFGANVTAFDFVNYFSRNLDNVLIGRVWGSETLGFYSRAYSLLMLPITAIRGPINAVAFPAMSRLQDDPERLRDYYLKVVTTIAWLSMPLAAFLFISSELIIELLLGKKWLGASVIFSWLALAAFVQPSAGSVGGLMLGSGQGRRYLECGVFNAIVVIVAFLIGVQWGAVGVAVAYVVASYIIIFPTFWWAFRDSPVTIPMFIKVCLQPVLFSIAGVVLVFLVKQTVFMPNLIGQIVVLGFVFLMPIVLRVIMSRHEIREMVTQLKAGSP